MRDKYFLYIPLQEFIYIYKYKENINFNINNLCNCSKVRFFSPRNSRHEMQPNLEKGV